MAAVENSNLKDNFSRIPQ